MREQEGEEGRGGERRGEGRGEAPLAFYARIVIALFPRETLSINLTISYHCSACVSADLLGLQEGAQEGQ
jgi:hypothetical protein